MKNKLLIIAVLCAGVGAIAATIGDPSPFGAYGVKQVASPDGGTPSGCVGIPMQNSVMVRNFVNDGGTSNTMYCGFDNSVNSLNGMPVQASESLTVDIKAYAIATNSGSDSLTDGGVRLSAGSVKPQLCCVNAPSNLRTDMHWMIVR